MRKIEFRQLTAGEIECRVAMVKENGIQLLLYKDARCDMSILDETVGPANWQRNHELINGNLFCTVGINVAEDDQEPYWVWKQDVGTESNTEKEKGQASDSFKRACVNWGIGRELYSSPFIWVKAADCEIKNGKCYDHFEVTDIGYTGGKISKLTIINSGLKDREDKTVFTTEKRARKKAAPAKKTEEKPEPEKKTAVAAKQPEKKEEAELSAAAKENLVTDDMIQSLLKEAARTGMNIKSYLKMKKINSIKELTIFEYKKTMNTLAKQPDKRAAKVEAEEGLPFR